MLMLQDRFTYCKLLSEISDFKINKVSFNNNVSLLSLCMCTEPTQR